MAKTIGMVDVACLTAATPFPPVTMTETLDWTNSAAYALMRSALPAAQR